jgi:predicted metal-dependent hydrolase
VTAPAALALLVRRGTRDFNRGRFRAAHEHWETAWREAPADVRPLLEALVQLAAGLHLRTARGGTRGAEHLLSQALVTLDDYRPSAQGIDVTRLIDDADGFLESLRAIRRPYEDADRGRLPRIHEVGHWCGWIGWPWRR